MKKVCTGPMEFTDYRPWDNERQTAAKERLIAEAALSAGKMKVPLPFLKRTVAGLWQMRSFDADDEMHRAGLFLLGSLYLFPATSIIARATGLERRECARFYRRLWEGEIKLGDRGQILDGPDPMTKALSFMLNCMVATGAISHRNQ